jgi:cytoskeletal protein CcmA (bactofilin family)
MTDHTENLQALCAEHQLGKSGRPVAIIGEAMVIHGSATARDDADVLVLGEVHGPVAARGAIVISRGARVCGGVQASRLCVLGELDAAGAEAGPADVQVDGLLDVRSSGVIRASKIHYAQLRSEAGGRISGQMNYSEQAGLGLQERPATEPGKSPEPAEAAQQAEVASAQSDDAPGEAAVATMKAPQAPQDLVEPPRLATLVHLPSLEGDFRHSHSFQRERGG